MIGFWTLSEIQCILSLRSSFTSDRMKSKPPLSRLVATLEQNWSTVQRRRLFSSGQTGILGPWEVLQMHHVSVADCGLRSIQQGFTYQRKAE
jgi:hypothetical protein